MYIEYMTYSFSMTIGLHVCDSWNITKQKEIEKIKQCASIKSFFSYGSGFFLKGRYYYAFIAKKNAKTHIFWMEFHPKVLNF